MSGILQPMPISIRNGQGDVDLRQSVLGSCDFAWLCCAVVRALAIAGDMDLQSVVRTTQSGLEDGGI